MSSTQVLFLGTGTSSGVPVALCHCATCTSQDPHDTRFNTSIMLIRDGFHLLVDAGPDFRHSALKFRVPRIDAVWITHTHFDHYGGLDYLRIYNYAQNAKIPLYIRATDLEYLQTKALNYLFTADPNEGGGISQIMPELINVDQSLKIGPFEIQPVETWHGKNLVCNLRVDQFAYLTDCSGIPDASLPKLGALDTLVLSALRYKSHRTHFAIEQSIAMTKLLAPRRTFFTHFAHDVLHQKLTLELNAQAPGLNILPAYDGLCLTIQ